MKIILTSALCIGVGLALAGCSSSKKADAANSTSTQSPAWAPQASSSQGPATVPPPHVAKDSETSLWSCAKAKEVRTLQVAAKAKGCELNYMKEGKNTVPASSTHSLNHCVQSEKKIKSKLEKAGYTCEVKG